MAKFGIVLPVTAGTSAWDYGLNFERMREVTKICEHIGLDSVWAADHLMTGVNNETFDAWTILAGLSQVTERMRLGTLVTCPTHRYPAVLAKLVATLDVMSNGRVDLGIGAGWNRKEQSAYGLHWEEVPRARIGRLVETIKILKGMWTNDSFTFTGKYYSVKDAVCLPKPAQKPTPPDLSRVSRRDSHIGWRRVLGFFVVFVHLALTFSGAYCSFSRNLFSLLSLCLRNRLSST